MGAKRKKPVPERMDIVRSVPPGRATTAVDSVGNPIPRRKTAAAPEPAPDHPFAGLFGKYANDPGWGDFEEGTQQSREEMNRAYPE